MKFGEWKTAHDPESGCSIELIACYEGHIAVRYDDEPPIFKTEEELMQACDYSRLGITTPEFLSFDLLRRHVLEGHPGMSFVELAER